MGAASARKYNRNQAKSVVDSLGRILGRVNKRYTPIWMLKELDRAYHKAQCIQGEYERVMRDHGDAI